MKSSSKIKMNFTRGLAKLVVMDAGADESGEYMCEASNAHGTVTKTVQLNVQGMYTHHNLQYM